MAETWTIKGPFRIVEHSWEYTSVYDADNKPVCTIQIDDEVTEETQDHFEKITEAKARAIASLPDLIEAAKLALDVLSAEAIGTHNPENQEWYESVCKAGDSLRDVLTRIQGGNGNG